MPWKETLKMNQKTEFALKSMRTENFRELCREYGISAKTGYKWKQRFMERGLGGMDDESRRPHSHASGLAEEVVCAIVRLKGKVRELWDTRQSFTSKQLRDQWQRYIRGWWNYFKLADWQREVANLTGWIRRHMRKCFWLRWKTPRGRRNALKRLGVAQRALGNAWSSRGAWAMARHYVLHHSLKNETLRQHGFIIPWDIVEARK